MFQRINTIIKTIKKNKYKDSFVKETWAEIHYSYNFKLKMFIFDCVWNIYVCTDMHIYIYKYVHTYVYKF